ncbi:MAG: nicotinate-nucleotide--dimethylbenzimidazole phosphoribosyltransferase [Kineosporiaceae bacterium]
MTGRPDTDLGTALVEAGAVHLAPPDGAAAGAARARIDARAKPPGSLGAAEDLAVWWAGVRGQPDPSPPGRAALVVLAGDHGITGRQVSAYPAAVTAAMVRTFLDGGAAASVLAREAGVALHVVDVAVDTDWEGVDLPAAVTAGKVRRGSGPLDTEDAVTPDELHAAVALGTHLADSLVDAGHDLLVTGDMGIGNTTAAAAVVAALTGLPVTQLVGRGTGVDDAGLDRKRRAVTAGLARLDVPGTEPADGWEVVRRVGGADLAAMAALCVRAAWRRTPVLLDGVVSGAAALVAESVAGGCAAWFAAGHRSPEPAHGAALAALGLRPVLDLGLRLGEGTGALLALPVLRAAVTVTREMAALADVTALLPDAGASG